MSYNDLRKGRWSEPGREYLVTMVTLHRRPVFGDFSCGRLFVRELSWTRGEGLCEWLAWVLMPDHFHGLLRLETKAELPSVLKKLKGRSARRIQQYMDQRGPFWQPGFHDRALRREENRLAIARYIIANPLRARLVRQIGDYPLWDCVWL